MPSGTASGTAGASGASGSSGATESGGEGGGTSASAHSNGVEPETGGALARNSEADDDGRWNVAPLARLIPEPLERPTPYNVGLLAALGVAILLLTLAIQPPTVTNPPGVGAFVARRRGFLAAAGVAILTGLALTFV